jgi:hypothetical protein
MFYFLSDVTVLTTKYVEISFRRYVLYMFSNLHFCQFVSQEISLFVLLHLFHYHTLMFILTQVLLLVQHFIKFVLSKFNVALLQL